MMPPQHYQIVNWSEIFENNKSRERDRCSWCPLPNKQDGLGYGLIMLEDDGPAIYGAFIAVVLMCSKQSRPRDGHLTDTGGAKGRPLAPNEISVKTKVPPNLIKRMLDVTCSESIGWIRVLGSVPAERPPSVEEGKGREGKGREGEGRYSTSNADLFWNLLSDLEDKPTISLAVECVRLANDSFKNVGTMFLENSF